MNTDTPFQKYWELVDKLPKFNIVDLIESLPEIRKKDPRAFFQAAKTVLKARKATNFVKGITDDDTIIDLNEGLRTAIKELYCPKRTNISGLVLKTVADYQLPKPFQINMGDL
jgi:hypothetical protein